MSVKLHLIDSEVPLEEHTDMIPFCELGKTVPRPVRRAVFEMRVTEDICRNLEDVLDMIKGLCSQCRRVVEIEGRYVYAIREGGEEKKGEVDASN
jgi:hypothetical protein